MKNAQSDIVGIADVSGNILAKYTYDCWGKLISITDENDTDRTTDTNFIGYINPLRYREYYYDSETGLYYLNARYYDPETGRFINADDEENLLIYEPGIFGLNLFNYCNNNPINMKDITGKEAVSLLIGGIVFSTPELVAIASTITTAAIYVLNVHVRDTVNTAISWAINQSVTLASSILEKFSCIGQWMSEQVSKLSLAYSIHLAKLKIPSRLLKDDGKLDLSKFNNRNGPKMPKGGRGILGHMGYFIVKDIDEHKGSAWKLFNKIGQRIASIAADGTIVGK